MPTDFWFRLSTYLALALSCVCLGYAEWQLLPAVTVFTAVVVVLLAASFFLDRRSELGLGKANLLGLGIGILAALWLVYHVARPPQTGPMVDLGWPTNLLPVIAPVLMVLIPAKLLRPKHVGDWWGMHGVALAGVALGSAMEDDGVFVVLLTAYAITAAWSLVLFFYRRSGGFLPPVPNRPYTPAPQVLAVDPTSRGPKWLFARSAVWLGLASAVAVPLFFVLPRAPGSPWAMTNRKYEVGQSSESRLDLNRTGELLTTEEVAYTLSVTTRDGRGVEALPAEQLWRARALTEYTRGAWSRGIHVPVMSIPDLEGKLTAATNPAEAGPDGFTVDFHPSAKETYPVLLAPVWWPANKSPVYWLNTGDPWKPVSDGTFVSYKIPLTAYRQVCQPSAADGLGRAFEVRGQPDTPPLVRIVNDPPRVRAYARQLLEQLIQSGRIPADARPAGEAVGRTDPKFHELVARAFSRHLSDSGEFTYSTTLTKQDPSVDVVEDFLFNTRSGNCELYATALVLLLRAVDVPAQYVTGYKGWETDDDGIPVIRRRQAHAWVEVLVSRPPPPGFVFSTPQPPHPVVWHWLSLDPTAGTSDTTTGVNRSWWERVVGFLTEFVIGYDKDKRQKAMVQARQWATVYAPLLLVGVGLLFAGRWGWRRWQRSRAGAEVATFDGPAWYGRFLELIARAGFSPHAGETPREFADRTTTELRTLDPAVADVPPFLTSKLYRLRYAGVPLTAEEEAQIEAALQWLDSLPVTANTRK